MICNRGQNTITITSPMSVLYTALISLMLMVDHQLPGSLRASPNGPKPDLLFQELKVEQHIEHCP